MTGNSHQGSLPSGGSIPQTAGRIRKNETPQINFSVFLKLFLHLPPYAVPFSKISADSFTIMASKITESFDSRRFESNVSQFQKRRHP